VLRSADTAAVLPPAAGTEVTQSYFPLGWGYEQRQQQCREVYGFTCCCPRCQTESHYDWAAGQQDDDDEGSSGEWETDDGDASMQEEEEQQQEEQEEQEEQDRQQSEEVMDGGAAVAGSIAAEQPVQRLEGEEGPADASYIQLFILKYTCPKPKCYGTLAPVMGTDVYECNVCSGRRSEAEFMKELEA
jgi:hypothetical protein